MNSIFKSLSDEAGLFLFVLILATLISWIAVFLLFTRQKKATQNLQTLFRGTSGENLETLLYDHLREKMRLEEKIQTLESEMADAQSKLQSAKRHFGLVRYDAFDDVAGHQSFALAMIDDDGNGVIVSGIVGRMEGRVYSKPIVNYRSDRTLSREEQRALQDAQSGGPRAILTE